MTEEIVPGFVALEESATIPTRATVGSAGYDLHALEGGTIYSGQRMLIKTGVTWQMPAGFVGLIKPRSGLAVKHGIDVLAGVVDSDYRGDIGVVLINFGEQPFEFKAGDRIAQMVIQQHVNFTTDVFAEDEERGEGGFGSTGE